MVANAIRFEQSVLDPWQQTLLRFVQRHHRPATPPEWKMMRYWFEMERLREEEQVMSLAADGDTLNTVIESETGGAHVWNFRADGGNYRVCITVRGRRLKDRSVYLKITDGEGKAVRSGKVFFPGLDSAIEMDANGRAKLSFADFQKYLREVMCFECDDGAIYKLDLE